MNMSIYVCDTSDQADEAEAYLIGMGFPAGQVTKEQVANLNYDAERWDGGSHDHFLTAKWVVIGRR
jgi:hypothetical protein